MDRVKKLKKRAVILYFQDDFANSVKPNQIDQYLQARNYDVRKFDTATLSRLGSSNFKKLLPAPHFKHAALYFLEGLLSIAGRSGRIINRQVNSVVMLMVMRLRGEVLHSVLGSDDPYDLLICEHNLDQAVVLKSLSPRNRYLTCPRRSRKNFITAGWLREEVTEISTSLKRKSMKHRTTSPSTGTPTLIL